MAPKQKQGKGGSQVVFFGGGGVPLDIDKVFKGRPIGFEASYDLAGCFT